MSQATATTTDTEAINKVLADLAIASDAAPDTVGASEFYTEDGVWDLGESQATGREEIAGTLQGMRDGGFAGPGTGTRHLLGLPSVTVNGDEATAVTYWTLIKGGEETALLAIGEYHDTFRRDADGSWRISLRKIVA